MGALMATNTDDRRGGVLQGWQRDGLRIDKFIFHVIESPGHAEEDNVVFLDEVTLSDDQRTFFLDRLKETAEGNTYTFLENATGLRNSCINLISDNNFVQVSREITRDFATHHGARMLPGIFIVAEVYVPMQNRQHGTLIFLVKVDNQKTIRVKYRNVDGRRIADFEDIPNALTENKNAVQKSALIDVNNAFKWDVLAFDRNAPSRLTRLSKFFENFLEVGIYGTPQSLTKKMLSTVRDWIDDIPVEARPEGLNRQMAKERVLGYIQGNAEFDTNTFISNILRDELTDDDDQLFNLREALREALVEEGLAGQRFTIDGGFLTKRERETRYVTHEGVTITTMNGAGADNIAIRWHDPQRKAGAAEIIIQTSNLKIDA